MTTQLNVLTKGGNKMAQVLNGVEVKNTISIDGDAARIRIISKNHGDRTIMVDTDDVVKITDYWKDGWSKVSLSIMNGKDRYYLRKKNGKSFIVQSIPRLVMGFENKGNFSLIVEHIDGNTSNCCKNNLKTITRSEQQKGKKKNRKKGLVYSKKQQEIVKIDDNTYKMNVSSRKHPDTWTYVCKRGKELLDKWYQAYGTKWGVVTCSGRLYVKTTLKSYKGYQQTILLHRCLTGNLTNKNCDIHHVDNDGLNNRRSNLEVVSRKDNIRYRKCNKTSKTGHRGVHEYTDKNGNTKFRAYIFNSETQKNKHLGVYDIIDDAIKSRKEAELKYYGYVVD